MIDTLSTDQTLYRIAELFGADMTRELISVDQTEGSLQVKGFVSSPVLPNPTEMPSIATSIPGL